MTSSIGLWWVEQQDSSYVGCTYLITINYNKIWREGPRDTTLPCANGRWQELISNLPSCYTLSRLKPCHGKSHLPKLGTCNVCRQKRSLLPPVGGLLLTLNISLKKFKNMLFSFSIFIIQEFWSWSCLPFTMKLHWNNSISLYFSPSPLQLANYSLWMTWFVISIILGLQNVWRK